jgi:hypothetical protein
MTLFPEPLGKVLGHELGLSIPGILTISVISYP